MSRADKTSASYQLSQLINPVNRAASRKRKSGATIEKRKILT